MSSRRSTSAAASQRQAPLLTLPRAAAAGQQTQFGHIRSLAPSGRARYILRFDPAWMLTGYPAQRAKLEERVRASSRTTPTSSMRRIGCSRTYVPAGTPATVLTHGTNTTSISMAVLARRVRTGQEQSVGFWLLIGNNTRPRWLSIDQQYRP